MTQTDTAASYEPPVAALLTYGNCNDMAPKDWPDYVSELGFTAEHIPELLRMMCDRQLWEADSESLAVWANAHAWRSLAQLKAIEAVEPLLELLQEYEEDDWLNIDAPEVLGRIGIAALPMLEAALSDPETSQAIGLAVAEGIERIATHEPEHRDACVAVLVKQLEEHAANEKALNGAIVAGLVELKAVEAVSLIEQVYASRNIDDMFAGTWARVQVDLGLKRESDFKPKDFQPQFYRNLQAAELIMNPDYFEDSQPDFDRQFRSPAAPLEFGKGDLKIPKPAAPNESKGFGQGSKPGKSKKKN